MRKYTASLLALCLGLSLAACGGGKKTELTKENIGDYLAFTSSVDCSMDTDSGSVLGLFYKNYSGDAAADIRIINQTGAKFENVTITLKLKAMNFDANQNGLICGWEFTSGNNHEGTSRSDALNYKTIKVALPYDGNWNTTEHLKLVLYSKWSDLIGSPSGLNSIYFEVTDVTGTVVG